MRFEKSFPDTIKCKVDYNEESPFKEIKVVRNMRQNVTLKAGYILPKAFKARAPVSKAKFDDLMELCDDLTVPSAHQDFYKNLPVLGQEEEEEEGLDSELSSEDSSDDE